MQFPMASNPDADEPRLNRRRPYELHWRREPPSWAGRIDSAYRRLYPHLTDEFCCVQCGSVPCPFDHSRPSTAGGDQPHDAEQNPTAAAATTVQRDTEFLGRVVAEKATLERQLAETQQTLEVILKQQAEWASEKELLLKRLADREQARKVLERERSALVKDVARLHILQCQQNDELLSNKKELLKFEDKQSEVRRIDEERQRQQEVEEKALRQALADRQTSETKLRGRVADLERQLAKLHDELVEATKKFADHKCTVREDPNVVRALVARATSDLEQQLRDATRRLDEAEWTGQLKIEELTGQLETVGEELAAAKARGERLEADLAERAAEIAELRRRLAGDRGFRRHIEVVRELNELRGKNELLMQRIAEMDSGGRMTGRMVDESVTMTTLGADGQLRYNKVVKGSWSARGEMMTGGRPRRAKTAISADRIGRTKEVRLRLRHQTAVASNRTASAVG